MSSAPPSRTTAAVAAPESTGELSHRQILTILSGLMAGMFLAALDQTIVATSIRTIADDLHGLSVQAWVTTAYLITATISTPLYGKLSDLYGRRPFFIAAISIFVAGSALSGFATSMTQLAAFRAFQGLGAGGLFSLALTIIGDIVPPRERAKYQGYFLAVFGTSSVLGPVIGGFLAGQATVLGITGWRWVFLVNVPVGIVALVLVMRSLHLPHTRRDHRIDWPGALALTVGLVPLLLIAEQGRDWGWTSTAAVTCYLVGVLGIIAFIWDQSRYGDDALIPLRLFRGRTFGIGSLLNFVLGMGMFGGLAALPLYLQIVKGVTPTEAGLLLLPLTAGIMSASIFSGQLISRTGRYKRFPVIGSVLLVLAMLGLAQIGVDTPIAWTMAMSALFGIGLGFNMQPLVLAVQNAVPPQDMGVATSSATFFRQMGGTLGTAVFLSILFSTVGQNIIDSFKSAARTPGFQAALQDPKVLADPASSQVARAIAGGGGLPKGAIDDTSFLSRIDDRLARPFLEGFSSSMDLVFYSAAVVLALAFAVVLFLPEEKLRSMSGIRARQHEEQQALGEESAAAAAVSAPSSQMVDGATVEASAPDAAAVPGARTDESPAQEARR